MVHRKKTSWYWSHDSAAILFFFKITLNNLLLWSGWTDRRETLHVWRLSMWNKSFTHMMSKVTWFGSHSAFTRKPIKNTPLKRSPGEGLQSLIALFLVILAEGEGIGFGSVCLSECLSAQNVRVFLHNHLSDWNEIFTIGATTHVECFNYNYDIIGHIVWQPCWKSQKILDLCISETTQRKKLKLVT